MEDRYLEPSRRDCCSCTLVAKVSIPIQKINVRFRKERDHDGYGNRKVV